RGGYGCGVGGREEGKCIGGDLYSGAGPGESTTDLAWDGHALIYENGDLLAESERFAREEQIVAVDIDLERLAQDRMRLTSFHDSVADHRDRVRELRRIAVEFRVPQGPIGLIRKVDRCPDVPSDTRRPT